ncbi:hypothetical protein RF683_07920 [Flavobacterium sp. 20NA77.7]|uniref:Intein N-terminal splicing region n=1 Tax=Flavobacterium nakdongensis TaxID=3073563 RepID=A0ABY9R8D0_9FLAO|nr:hypothetical protein [Flavobacterium sp. 20NA77.7]WMW77414.1 hypothetical protein RF683_07920 [Flavobacterium sp. 20NA77.7]
MLIFTITSNTIRMKLSNIIFFIFFSFYSYCQDKDEQIVLKVVGDLNSDNLIDEVIINKDSTDTNYPFILNVFLLNDKKERNLIATSNRIILQARTRKKLIPLQSYCNLKIEDNKVIVNYNIDSAYSIYKFGFQDSDFILLEYYGEFNNGNGKQVENYTSKNGKTEIIIKDKNDNILTRKEKVEGIKKLDNFEVDP